MECRSVHSSAPSTRRSRSSTRSPRARSPAALARRTRSTGASCTPATTRSASRCPTSCGRSGRAQTRSSPLSSYARLEAGAGGRTLIATADRDLYQAVDERTSVVAFRPGGAPATLGPREVRERYGIDPSQVPDLIALRGDPSDGLPGAKGIGAKTAAALLREHRDLDGVLSAAAAGRLAPRLSLALRAQAGELRAFREIATLQDVALERPPDAPTDRPAGAAAARELGMTALAKRLESN